MTREEAIESIKQFFAGIDIALSNRTKEALDVLIPGLAEGEDERIRKWLIDYFTEIGENWIHREFTCKQIVAYLEKQKEQPKEELVYRLNGFMQEYIKEGKDAAEKEHRFKCYQLFWDALEDENFFEQKEQKPAETDEYKIIKKHITKDVLSSEVNKRLGECGWYVTDEKPAEWSEEDKKRIQRIYDFLWKNRKGDTDTIYQIEKDADWIKSLRPDSYKNCNSRWKPSEEQIEALRLSFEEAFDDAGDCNRYRRLKSLYEQLKKLM